MTTTSQPQAVTSHRCNLKCTLTPLLRLPHDSIRFILTSSPEAAQARVQASCWVLENTLMDWLLLSGLCSF